MPQIDGLLLVQFLRSQDAPTCKVPLIVLSSKEDPLIIEQGIPENWNEAWAFSEK